VPEMSWKCREKYTERFHRFMNCVCVGDVRKAASTAGEGHISARLSANATAARKLRRKALGTPGEYAPGRAPATARSTSSSSRAGRLNASLLPGSIPRTWSRRKPQSVRTAASTASKRGLSASVAAVPEGWAATCRETTGRRTRSWMSSCALRWAPAATYAPRHRTVAALCFSCSAWRRQLPKPSSR